MREVRLVELHATNLCYRPSLEGDNRMQAYPRVVVLEVTKHAP